MIVKRLEKLRRKMAEKAVDYYMIPTADFHNSEYVSDYFKVRQFFSGFTGSNGTLVVWQEGAGLWTDGRYFIQAAKELEGSGITLFKMGEEGVPTITEFLAEQMQEHMTLGFDGRVLTAKEGIRLEEKLAEKHIRLGYDEDLSLDIWADRPEFPQGPIQILPEELTGKALQEKVEEMRQMIKKEQADSLFLSKLDEIMWLLNIRGCDVECNPVAMSYFYLTLERAVVFLSPQAVSGEVEAYFRENQVEVRDYAQVGKFLEELQREKVQKQAGTGTDSQFPSSNGKLAEIHNRIWLDTQYTNYTLYCILKEKMSILDKKNPTELPKARKNPVELAHMREIYLKDSVAVTKFIYWLKKNIGKKRITEVSAADYLEQLRREIPEFQGLSFPTIAGYNANGAMMHYEATPEKYAVLEPEGLLLVDSGGQYLGGTTDVTRTIVLGPISEEMKKHYTAVAAGMLSLTNAKWLQGCSGRNLDILARKPIWDMDLDYQCGTGHGVGYMLNVHEGPQSMRWRFPEGATEAILEEGMDITNEPGIYIEGSHGIRIENVLVVRKSAKNLYGQFLEFETLTWVPLDMQAIVVEQLTLEQQEYLKAYQSLVYEKISPYLDSEEQQWLYQETRWDF